MTPDADGIFFSSQKTTEARRCDKWLQTAKPIKGQHSKSVRFAGINCDFKESIRNTCSSEETSMESEKPKISGVIRNAHGEGCIAVEQTDGGVLHYFQNEADIDRLLGRMIAQGALAEDERGKLRSRLLKSTCHRHSGGFCIGDCTSGYVTCRERGTPPYEVCDCC